MKIKSRIQIGSGCLGLGTRSRSDPVGASRIPGIHEIPLSEKSKGAVNVRAPSRYWGGKGAVWKSDKLAGYLTKYIHKDFENSAKGAKRYWHTRGIEPIKCIKFWVRCHKLY
ncbi:MAG: hypothetical protein DID89_2727546069 [Candidatus Nitrotoga sp. CP45]|nr:MAG: hypothetical protein DID89_2727546069 [Candidatus Nitrotoga sp. CP45]